jgi:hypothetical protein
MMGALSSSETSVLTRATRRKIPGDVILHRNIYYEIIYSVSFNTSYHIFPCLTGVHVQQFEDHRLRESVMQLCRKIRNVSGGAILLGVRGEEFPVE